VHLTRILKSLLTYLLSYLCDMIMIMMNRDKCTLFLHDVTVYFFYIFKIYTVQLWRQLSSILTIR